METELLNIPKIEDERGNLSFIEEGQLIPFAIGGVQWLTDAPSGSSPLTVCTGGDSDIVIALSGAFELGFGGTRQWITRPNVAQLLGPGQVYDVSNCSSNVVVLRITSQALVAAPEAAVPQDAYRQSSVDNCATIALHTQRARMGHLTTFMTADGQPLFRARRVYYLYDVPAGAERGGHAHSSITQLLVAATGSFEVTLDDGCHRKTVILDRPDVGLLITPGIWRTIDNFSAGATCLVIASKPYSEADYVREYHDFSTLTAGKC